MTFWKNTHTNQRVYPESDQYYQSNGSKKTVLAWAAAFGSLMVIVGLFLGLFFGGRWAYRQLRNDSNETVATIEKNTNSSTNVSEDTNTSTNTTDENIGSETTNTDNSSSSNNSSADSASDTASEPKISNATTEEPGISANSTMPNTGAGIYTLVSLFGIVTILSTVFYSRHQKTN